MDDEEAPSALTQEQWNGLLERLRWHHRDRGRFEKPSLSGLVVRGLTTPEGFDFQNADLSGSQFEDLTLSGCKFNFANLTGCDFVHSVMSGCRLDNLGLKDVSLGELRDCALTGISFDGCSLHERSFDGCSFRNCKFAGAILEYTKFSNCSFESCDFSRSTGVGYVTFEGAPLSYCNLAGVDLSRWRGFRLDRSDIHGARLPDRSDDPLSVLFRTYTGPRMLFTLLLLAVYFAPFALKGVALVAVAHVERSLIDKALLGEKESCAALHCVAVPVWRVAFGLTAGAGPKIAGVALLVYNILRAFLTWRIGPMLQEQSISHITPAYARYARRAWAPLQSWRGLRERARIAAGWVADASASYWWLYFVHRVIRLLFLLATALCIYHLVKFFTDEIILPGNIAGVARLN